MELLNGVSHSRCHLRKRPFRHHAADGQFSHTSQLSVIENIVGEQPQDELPTEGLDVLECNRVRLHSSLLHHGSDLDNEEALKTSQYGPHDDVVASGLLALSL